ncbi:MAG: hypothetical protein WKF70_10470, partial [Chitinophagaceae bacterium]
VTRVEELQMINNKTELDRLFTQAKSALVNGASVILYRKWGQEEAPFDKITTEADLDAYHKIVFKYLSV